MANVEDRIRSALTEVVDQELARAGFTEADFGTKSKQQIVYDLMTGENTSRGRATQFRRLIELGQGTGVEKPEEVKGYLDENGRPLKIFNRSASDIWTKQRDGWDGYGWTQEKVDKAGRLPESRELSEGGRAAWDWKRRKELVDGLDKATELGKKPDGGFLSTYSYGPGSNPVSPSQKAAGQRNEALAAYEKAANRTHGESGWLGSLGNTEYKAGWFMNRGQAFSDAAGNQIRDHWQEEYPDITDSPIQDLAQAGRAVGNFFSKHLPVAADIADARAAANKVEPLIPAGETQADGRKLLYRLSDSGGHDFDTAYRLKHGQYPTYAGSSAMTFLNGLLDPSILASGPAARIATTAGKALAGAGLKMPGMLGDLVSRYGVSVAKAARPLARLNLTRAALNETVEELPTNVGINSAAAFGPQLSGVQGLPPLPSNFFAGGDARSDLHTWDEGRQEFRPETEEEFRAKAQQQTDDYKNLNRKIPSILRTLPTTPRMPLPQKPN